MPFLINALEEIPFPINSTINIPYFFFVIESNLNSYMTLTIDGSLKSNTFSSEAIRPSKLISAFTSC